MRTATTIASVLLALAGYAGTPDAGYGPPHFNFSSYEVLVREDILASGVTIVVFDGSEPYLNGFFAPACRLRIGAREIGLHNAIFLNLDVILRTNRSPDEVLLHELAHYRQYLRCGSPEAYFAEWHRQQALPYWQRPWELEAHAAETSDDRVIAIVGRRAPSSIAIRFEQDQGRLANRAGE